MTAATEATGSTASTGSTGSNGSDGSARSARGARILLSQAHVTEAEQRAVADAVLGGWVAPLGPEVDAFERELAAYIGVEHALALSSGSAALHLALLGVGVGPGSVVPVSGMTFAASVNAISYTGAVPVFVDSLPGDGNVDPDLLLAAVDDQRRAGAHVPAVMTVDLLGRCVDYDRLVEELAAREVALVEDAAEALGASRGGRRAGAFGTVSALSFNGNKIMTTSGGGMLLSDDAELVARARYLSTQARQPVPWYEHTEVGYNYRLSNLLAALGRAQLARLDGMIERRRAIRARYAATVADLPGVRILGRDGDPGDEFDNCWLTSIVLEDSTIGPDAVIAALDTANIEARHLWKPMQLQPAFADRVSYGGEVSERLFRTGVTLPSGSVLTDDDIDRVCTVLVDVLR